MKSAIKNTPIFTPIAVPTSIPQKNIKFCPPFAFIVYAKGLFLCVAPFFDGVDIIKGGGAYADRFCLSGGSGYAFKRKG